VSDTAGAPDFSQGASPRFVKARRDPEETRVAIERWLRGRLSTPVHVSGLDIPTGAGVSNETFLFRARREVDGRPAENEYVLRLHPSPDYQVFFDPEFRMQFDLLDRLREVSDVRVPEVHWFEDDPATFGRPFFVMERKHGRVPVSIPLYNREGFLVEATPAQRRRAWHGAIAQMAAIHAVPGSEVEFLDRPQWGATPLEQQLTYWKKAAEWGLGDHYLVQLDEMISWLRDNQPESIERGLSWGDARLGNVMFDDNFDVAAVLDWEQASLIGPTADLAWWLFFDEMFSTGQGVPGLPGMGDRDETLALWSSLSGRTPHDLHWHEVFVGYKMANLAIRTTVVLASARGAAPVTTLNIVNGALGRLDLQPVEGL
jgi:aminoglycoside phosphotransferase (APT) family kinase protein